MPTGTLVSTEIVNVDTPVAPGCRARVLGANFRFMPCGFPEPVRVMFCPTGIPGRPGIETVAVAEDPCETLTTGGDTTIENSSTKIDKTRQHCRNADNRSV